MPNRTTDEQRLLEKAGRYLPGGSTGNLHFNPEQDFLISGGKGSASGTSAATSMSTG